MPFTSPFLTFTPVICDANVTNDRLIFSTKPLLKVLQYVSCECTRLPPELRAAQCLHSGTLPCTPCPREQQPLFRQILRLAVHPGHPFSKYRDEAGDMQSLFAKIRDLAYRTFPAGQPALIFGFSPYTCCLYACCKRSHENFPQQHSESNCSPRL